MKVSVHPEARFFLFVASLSGLLSVLLGAFGAHVLKVRLDEYSLSIFRTGVEYQFYHTFAIALVGLLSLDDRNSLLTKSGIAFLLGIPLFSLSLYILALTQMKWLGAITPLGGLCFLVGWALLARAVFQANRLQN